MSRSDEYVTVVATMKMRTAKAVLLNVGKDVERGGWVPRSCLHVVSDDRVRDADVGDELTLEVREWVAEEKGLV